MSQLGDIGGADRASDVVDGALQRRHRAVLADATTRGDAFVEDDETCVEILLKFPRKRRTDAIDVKVVRGHEVPGVVFRLQNSRRRTMRMEHAMSNVSLMML